MGYHTLTPDLAVDDATEAIEFYKRAFGARERRRLPTPEGKIAHAELEIGDSVPFGHEWQIATHKEDLTDEEIAERAKEAMASLS